MTPRRERVLGSFALLAIALVAALVLFQTVLAPPAPRSALESRSPTTSTSTESPAAATGSPATASATITDETLAPGTATYRNPVLDADFPDPTVIKSTDGWYYAYATQTITPERTINIQVARSKDLITWEMLGDALPSKPKWASGTQDFWAPHVAQHGGRYFMYYSAEPNTQNGLCLAVAVASRPMGPFTDVGKPLQCGGGFVNIDPMAFDDPSTGKRLLYWGSGFESIRVRELAANRTSFAAGSKVTELLEPNGANEYENLVEGAWVIVRAGWYYLFYSGDACCGPNAHYAVMVARSRSATGPFEKLADVRGNYDGTILTATERWIAPGHNSVVRDSAGQDWLVYHAINPDQPSVDPSNPETSRRPMLIDRLTYGDGWPVVGDAHPSSGDRAAPKP